LEVTEKKKKKDTRHEKVTKKEIAVETQRYVCETEKASVRLTHT
jgi:hypothetical protein